MNNEKNNKRSGIWGKGTLSLLFIFCTLFAFKPERTNAQDSLSLSVTPPIFQLNVKPGDTWTSALKLVNSNPYDLTLYTIPVNFNSSDEEGHAEFRPILDTAGNSVDLASWIDITREPILIPREKSVDITFTIRLPKDASPGGHYAAILVGTQPPNTQKQGEIVRISSFVSSLIFIRVPGDIREEGYIQSFSSENVFYQKPDVSFTLRFENMGNVHLRPAGDITIYNMFGRERGKIPINDTDGDFGNVLPKSVRRFDFDWKGDGSIFEIGKFSAVATLTFGSDGRQNVSRSTFFWVIPIKPVLGIAGGGILFIFFLVWAVRAYIRSALVLEAEKRGVFISKNGKSTEEPSQPEHARGLGFFAEPFYEGVIDLRKIRNIPVSASENTDGQKERVFGKENFLTIGLFLRKYYKFFIFLLGIVLGVWGVTFSLHSVLTPERDFSIIIRGEDGAKKAISSEEVIRGEIGNGERPLIEQSEGDIQAATALTAEEKRSLLIKIINGSGRLGAAAELSLRLEKAGYAVSLLGSVSEYGRQESLIEYRSGKRQVAEGISVFLDGDVILSENKQQNEDISITLGAGLR